MGRRPARVTQADIARAIRAVQERGLPVGRVEIEPDGRIVIVPGVAEPVQVMPYSPADALKALREARKRGAA
jgi:hypothetical protein